MTLVGAHVAGWQSLAELAAHVLDDGPMDPGVFVRQVQRALKRAGVSAYKGDAHNAIAAGDGVLFQHRHGKWEKI